MTKAADNLQSDTAPSRSIPSWVISVVLHMVILLILGWVIKTDTRTKGIFEEAGRETGIVLKKISNNTEYYDGEDSSEAASDSQANPTDSTADSALPNSTTQFAPAATDVPDSIAAIGPQALENGALPSAGKLPSGAKQPSGGSPGSAAKVNIYGAEAEGHKFVFVFDRSVSMDGAPLASAKKELLEGISKLERTHQFQVIFFNHETRMFDLSGSGRLPFADDRVKKLAANFVGGITAAGNTDRMKALYLALGMRPDVIFFLTDADDPLRADELESISRRNKDITSINTIEFGYGANPGGANFLTRMAAENNGKSVYVDTSLLER